MRFVASLLASSVLLGAQPAGAQTYTSGAEVVPTWSNSVTWTPPIDPDDPHPADADEPAADDENGYDRDLWLASGTDLRTDIDQPGGDGKFRTLCHATFTKRADPLLFPGVYPAGHDHTFFGPMRAEVIADVQNWDYQMGRDYPGSSCDGGPLNTTLYWEPSVKDSRYGINLTVIPSVVNFYYTHAGADGPETTRLRRDFRFISGVNPMDFNDTAIRAELATAGLEYPGSPSHTAGFLGIQCDPTSGAMATVVGDHRLQYPTGAYHSTEARYLVGPNGEDPWDGACTAGEIIINTAAPACWDGTNLSSPDGRRHVRHSTRDEDNAPPAGQCPDNYVKVLTFATKVHFEHNGWEEDLQFWYMGSDRMRVATTECPDPTEPCDGVSGGNVPATVGSVYYSRESLSPCRSTGLDFCPLETAHFDWWGSWDNEVIESWERNCGGLTIGGVTTDYADCGTSVVSDTTYLTYGDSPPPESGLSTDPVRSLDVETATSSTEGQRYFPINPEDENQGPLDVDVHH